MAAFDRRALCEHPSGARWRQSRSDATIQASRARFVRVARGSFLRYSRISDLGVVALSADLSPGQHEVADERPKRIMDPFVVLH